MLYKNNKNGKVYEVLNTDVIDATNSINDSGREMVLYKDYDGVLYVRDREEFFSKFTKIGDHNIVG